MFKLRDYQQRGIDNIRQAYIEGHQGVLLVLPTGGGKTIMFSEIVRLGQHRGTKAVILAHRQELVWQASSKLKGYGIDHGVVMGKYNTRPSAVTQVCSIDSMRNRNLLFMPDLIVIDEAHLINSKRYTDFIQRYPDARRLLVTATASRLDGKGFTEFASSLVVGANVKQLIDQGHLVPARVLTSPLGFNLSEIRMRGKDFDDKELNDKLNTRRLVGNIVQEYQEHAAGRRAVCFAVSVEHSQNIVSAFCEAGIPAAHVDGTTPEATRRTILQKLHDGDIMVVSNCGVLCEGWDEPRIECVILARPTQSETLYIQQAGRGLRPCSEIGKTECLILDHAEHTARYGPVEEERQYSLEGRMRKKKKPTDRQPGLIKTGAQLREIEEVEARLMDITELHPEEARLLSHYRQYLREAHHAGRKKAWAWYQLRERHGYHPVTLLYILGDKRAPYGFKETLDYGESYVLAQQARSIEEAFRWSA